MNTDTIESNIKHVHSLDGVGVVNLGDELLAMPGVRTSIRTKGDVSYKHAVVLNNACADVDMIVGNKEDGTNLYVGRYTQMTEREAVETLRAALYLYAIHYPGTMVAAIAHTK
jgi:hypothetical protein